MMVTPSANVLYETDHFAIGIFKNVTVVVWATQGTVALITTLDELSEDVRKAHPEGFSAVHIVKGNAPLPDGPGRSKYWVTPRPFKLKTFSTIREVAKWLPVPHAERTGVVIESRELELVLVSFRERVS